MTHAAISEFLYRQWFLDEATRAGRNVDLPVEEQGTVRFTRQGRVEAHDTVNFSAAPFRLTNDRLVIGAGFITLVGSGPDPRRDNLADAIHAVFNHPAPGIRYEASEHTLRLYAGPDVLTFVDKPRRER